MKKRIGGEPFTDAELDAARAKHGTTATCPKCGTEGDIDDLFGWRRDGTSPPKPQSWCYACRLPDEPEATTSPDGAL